MIYVTLIENCQIIIHQLSLSLSQTRAEASRLLRVLRTRQSCRGPLHDLFYGTYSDKIIPRARGQQN